MVHPPDYDPGEGHDFECQTQYENEAESKCDEGTKCVIGSQCSTKGKILRENSSKFFPGCQIRE